MLASSKTEKLQNVLNGVIEESAHYGLELKWGKTVAIGKKTKVLRFMTRRGHQYEWLTKLRTWGLLTSDMSTKPELTRRIGVVKAIFQSLNT